MEKTYIVTVKGANCVDRYVYYGTFDGLKKYYHGLKKLHEGEDAQFRIRQLVMSVDVDIE